MVARAAPIRVVVVDDYPLVVAGVHTLLTPYAERIVVLDPDDLGELDPGPDLVLVDTMAPAVAASAGGAVLRRYPAARRVVFSWRVHPAAIREALRAGAAGYLSKRLDGPELVGHLEAIHAGHTVVCEAPPPVPPTRQGTPQAQHELTAREAEIVSLIVQGMSNQEIATLCFLSINSIKTYIRSAYRKMGVASRSQALLWGLRHGLGPDLQDTPTTRVVRAPR